MTGDLFRELLEKIRTFLNSHFDDPALDAFCQSHFLTTYSKFSRGLRKDEKIGVLLEDCLHNPTQQDTLLRQLESRGFVIEDRVCSEFFLEFANREKDKGSIYCHLDGDFYVQVCAPGGLGKTYLLREIQREKACAGWHTVWFDLAGEHKSCLADPHKFRQEFYRQVGGDNDLDYEEEQAFDKIVRRLADHGQVLLLIDNADQATSRLLTWLRGTFLEGLSRLELPIRVLASGQQVIPEWKGYRLGQSFHELPLSSFEDRKVIRDILDDVASRVGSAFAKKRRKSQVDRWNADLDAMVEGLLQVTRGHPLAIEEVLRYAVKHDGFVHADFFSDQRRQTELINRCLNPLVDERVLSTLDNKKIRGAFRGLCVFRYIWPGLIHRLTDVSVGEDLGGPWKPFHDSGKSWAQWWCNLEESHLIADVGPRQMYPISPAVRQVIALVLWGENESLYRARNRRARQEYEWLIGAPDVNSTRKAASVLEVLYHRTQDSSLAPVSASAAFAEVLTDFLTGIPPQEKIEIGGQLRGWLRSDAELGHAIEQYAGPGLYERLIEIVVDFVDDWKGGYL